MKTQQKIRPKLGVARLPLTAAIYMALSTAAFASPDDQAATEDKKDVLDAVTVTAQKRMHPKAMQYGGADSVMYGYALHKHDDLDGHANSLVKSRPDEMLEEGQHAGHDSAYLDARA